MWDEAAEAPNKNHSFNQSDIHSLKREFSESRDTVYSTTND